MSLSVIQVIKNLKLIIVLVKFTILMTGSERNEFELNKAALEMLWEKDYKTGDDLATTSRIF